MSMMKLAERQLLLMKRENLEKRVRANYAQTQDADSLIEYGVAILVRNFFCLQTFSDIIMDLIRDVYLTVEATDIMCQNLPYFKEYFSANEWKSLIKQLFGSHSNYLVCTKEARSNKSFLEKKGTLEIATEGLDFRVEAFFEDSNGKKHKLTIRETDPTIDEEVTIAVLKILTTLRIFDTDGVRKFATYVSYQTPGMLIASSHSTKQKRSTKERKASAAEKTSQKPKGQKQPVQPTGEEQASIAAQTSNDSVEEIKGTASSPKNTAVKGTSPNSTASKNNGSSRISSEANNYSLDAKPHKGHSSASSQKSDRAYMRFAKSGERIEHERKEKRLQREVDKVIGKKKNRRKNKRK